MEERKRRLIVLLFSSIIIGIGFIFILIKENYSQIIGLAAFGVPTLLLLIYGDREKKVDKRYIK